MAKKKLSRRGGPQPRSGSRTRYPRKVMPPKTFALTRPALDRLGAMVEQHAASESDIVCNLLLESDVKNLPPMGTAG